MQVLPRAIDADLMREHRLPLTEYTALMHLSEAPDRRMRMSELAAACDLSLSGMTRIVTRLETQGLVERERARRTRVARTPSSPTRAWPAWKRPGPSHLAAVRRRFLQHFEGFDLAQLARAFQRAGMAEPTD